MKKHFILSVILILNLCFVACNNSGTKSKQADDTIKISTTEIATYNLDDLLKVADQNVDKQVNVIGYITHTCKHSGKRCFIVGDDQNISLRVEAKGNIGGFNRELMGSKVKITGTFKERRLTKEYIDQMEKDVNEKKIKEDGSAESCQAELNNISQMKKWMADNGKDYYSLYYMDGEEYEVLN